MKLFFLILCLSFSVHAKNIGRIIRLNGSVLINNKLPSLGDYIKEHDIVTTKKGYIKVILNDDSVIQLGINSSLVFEKFIMKNKKDRTSILNLIKGTMRSLFIHKSNKRSITVKAKEVSLGIRGTDFITKVNKQDVSVFLVTGNILAKINNKKITIKPQQSLSFNQKIIKVQREKHFHNIINKINTRMFKFKKNKFNILKNNIHINKKEKVKRITHINKIYREKRIREYKKIMFDNIELDRLKKNRDITRISKKKQKNEIKNTDSKKDKK